MISKINLRQQMAKNNTKLEKIVYWLWNFKIIETTSQNLHLIGCLQLVNSRVFDILNVFNKRLDIIVAFSLFIYLVRIPYLNKQATRQFKILNRL